MARDGAAARAPRVRQSELAVPAASPHFFARSAQGEADFVFLDLEDAVAPAGKVEACRANGLQAIDGRHADCGEPGDHRIAALRGAVQWARAIPGDLGAAGGPGDGR